MNAIMLRLAPALVAALLLAVAGAANAHGLDDLIQCVFAGPFDNCG